MPKLSVDNLSVYYGKLRALWDVSFNVRDRSVTCLLGPNGAGKTTTLKAVAGLLPGEGNVEFDGFELRGLSSHARVNLGISLVPEGRMLFPDLSVYENLRSGAYSKRARARIADTLELVYQIFPILKQRREQSARTLSGGEQQMLAIGRALMSKPKLLMLDEPTTGLQPTYVDKAFDLVQQLRDEGMTIVLVEQNAYDSLMLADEAYIMGSGRVIFSGTGKELMEEPEVKKVYLGQ